MKRALDKTIRGLGSERLCLRCGCVRARHPSRYCTFHGPQRCRRFIPTLRLGEAFAYGAVLSVWAAALGVWWKAPPWQ